MNDKKKSEEIVVLIEDGDFLELVSFAFNF